jgi:hypothetical protein
MDHWNITIPQNATYELAVGVTKVSASIETVMDLTGYTCRSSIKKNFTDTKIYATMSCENTLDISGSIELTIPASVTKTLKPGSYYYDVLIITGSKQTRILYGVASVIPYVTE